MSDRALRRFPVPEGIPSAVTLRELAVLQRYAHEAGTVLEIGTYLGFACIGMALTGADVTSVDPHNEGPGGSSTWESFRANCERHGWRERGEIIAHHRTRSLFESWTFDSWIEAWRHPVEYWAPAWTGTASMVFIDGDHAAPAPVRDTEIAKALLAPDGCIALHDVSPARWPDVYAAAQALVASGWRELERIGCLRVYQQGPWPPGHCRVCGARDGTACRTEVHEG